MRSPQEAADFGLMAAKQDRALSDKQIRALFRISNDEEDAYKSARMFFDAVTEAVEATSEQHGCGAWTRGLDWPAVFKGWRKERAF